MGRKLEEQLKETQVAKDELVAQLQEEMDAARQRQEEASKALMAVSTTPSHHHLRARPREGTISKVLLKEVEEGDDDSEDEEHLNNGNVSRGGNLRDDDDDVSDPVNERLTLAEKNERLQNQLRSLKEDLAHTRDDQAETTMDKIHKENVKQGRDKYKTLREVRKGNTKRRVDQFENM